MIIYLSTTLAVNTTDLSFSCRMFHFFTSTLEQHKTLQTTSPVHCAELQTPFCRPPEEQKLLSTLKRRRILEPVLQKANAAKRKLPCWRNHWRRISHYSPALRSHFNHHLYKKRHSTLHLFRSTNFRLLVQHLLSKFFRQRQWRSMKALVLKNASNDLKKLWLRRRFLHRLGSSRMLINPRLSRLRNLAVYVSWTKNAFTLDKSPDSFHVYYAPQ